MSNVAQRFNVLPVEEWDPSLLPNINFGFAESHEGGDSALRSYQDGSFGLISGHNIPDQIDRETVRIVAPLVERQLDNANFDFRDPEMSMRDIFRMAQEEVKDAARSNGPGYKTRIDMSLVKVFIDSKDQQIKAAYGHSGRHSIIHVPNGKQLSNLDPGLSESNVGAGIGIPPHGEGDAKFGVLTFSENDRIIIQSRNAAGYDQDEAYSKDELLEALRQDDPDETAKLLIRKNSSYKNRSALVIVAPESNPRQSAEKTGVLGRMMMLGAVGAMTSAMIMTRRRSGTSRWSDFRNRNRNRDDEPVVIDNSTSTRVVSAEDDIRSDRHDREPRRWSVGSRQNVRHDHESEREGGRGRRALMLGALAVGTYLTMRYAMDLGDGAPHWLSGLPDTGIDINPFGGGDLDDGNRTGWDLNPSNENLAWNDDPINPNFQDTGGIDLIPLVDGDWFSLNSWDIDWPNGVGEPSVDIDMDGDIDAPNANVNTPDANLDAPDVSLPEVDSPDVDLPDVDLPDVDAPDVDVPDVDVPDVEPVAPPPPPPAWVPENFVIEKGDGLNNVYHKLGHKIVGFENFTGSDAIEVNKDVQAMFGDGALNLPDHAGSDIYKYGNEIRISAPGRGQWMSQAVERFVHEDIIRLSKKKVNS